MCINKYCCNNKNNKLQQKISYICNCKYKYFLNKRHVVGIGLGYKVKNGFYTNQLCIQVFVSRKIPSFNLLSNNLVPSIYDGIPTDVVETGYFHVTSLRNRIRPVPGGYSISSLNAKDGTAGCLVTNGVQNFVLSTNHLLADENRFSTGYPILQPAYIYGGRRPNDVIATLYKYVPLHQVQGEFVPINLSDCAIGVLTDKNIFNSKIAFIGEIKQVKPPRLNAPVKKVGSTTDLTTGIISSIDVTIQITYPSNRNYLFKNIIFTSKMADEGDSGSILVNSNNCATGLLFANAEDATAFNRLDIVLDQLDVHLPN